MTGKDVLYHDFRKYLQDHGVGFPADLASSLDDEFLKHIAYSFFPLGLSVWVQINDKHNRGAAPDPGFEVFFGRKKLRHKTYRPSMATNDSAISS
jgi:hypothetical protein